MLYFENDYCEGAHEAILRQLLDTNMEKLPGYGNDHYCESAKKKIRQACDCPRADICFLTGGTQTNAVVIHSLLKCYQGVIAAKTGHISMHEAGAVEFTGHKVIELPHDGQGKIPAAALREYLQTFYGDRNHEHMVFPGMVYISQPTEYGTLYSKKELEDISSVCKSYNLPLYLDGARLGYGLASLSNNVSLADIARCTSVFYIGGTKVGALCGEAVVFTQKAPEHFSTIVKQQGALLAKGRLLGIQFDTLFTNDLFLKISKNAIDTARKLKTAFQEKGYQLYMDSPTNQIFIILENKKMEELEQHVKFSFWEKYDENHTIVRFATSWASKMEEIDELIELL